MNELPAVERRPPYAWSPKGWASEGPANDPDTLEIWCYTDQPSYAPGDRVRLHVHTTAPSYSIAIVRDGLIPQTVYERQGLPGSRRSTPQDSYARGCGWPESTTVAIHDDWPSGFYLVVSRAKDINGTAVESEHFFVVRPKRPATDARIALVLTTSTLNAYNDWGGANHYRGIGDDPRHDVPSPILSTQRPIGRGLLRKPIGAPRESNSFTPPAGWIPRYESYEWARLHGYSRHHADAFWATYERPFALWAEHSRYALDYYTQHDLHFRPEMLFEYPCWVVVGHDEYWTWEMRDAVDQFVEAGGNLARFAGNFLWQVRLERGGLEQVCYKMPELDPQYRSEQRHLVTTAWDHPVVGRPAAQTMGLTGWAGIYARYGNATPRSGGGYTVYRPHHWTFTGTDLYYGDMLGAAPVCLASFEVDGVDYTFRKGLPFPTHEDSAPDSLEILAMAPAVAGEEDRWGSTVPLGSGGLAEVEPFMREIRGEGWEYGVGMMATFTRGAGTVFNAGTAEWVRGLIDRDPQVEQVTRNILDRFIEG